MAVDRRTFLKLTSLSVLGIAGERTLFAMLDQLDRGPGVSILLLPPEARDPWAALAGQHGKLICIGQDAPPDQIAARISAASAFEPVISDLRSELAAARDKAAGAARAVDQVSEELRLAAKLQRDFLPKRLPQVGPLSFGALFRPIGWVSGDIYDVFRLDERHVGFYVVDVVGHGMPAALLTMFIKKALQTKRIVGNTYQIVPPHVAMAELNADICEQDLPSCQFCTAAYCLVDTAAMELTYCRAGHPEPVLIDADGQIEPMSGPGSLLGVFADEEYHSRQVSLRPGDRVLLFTDGMEDALRGVGESTRPPLADIIAPWARLPRQDLLVRLTAILDELFADGQLSDDSTVVVMDVSE